MKLGQGNIFTPVCDSVNRGGVPGLVLLGVPGLVLGGVPGLVLGGCTWSGSGGVPGRHPNRTRYTPRGPGIPLDQVPSRPGTPHGTRYTRRNTANERPVRILLECILVFLSEIAFNLGHFNLIRAN